MMFCLLTQKWLCALKRCEQALVPILLLSMLAINGNAAEPARALSPQAMVILKANCFACHNAEKKKGGLLLTSRKDLLKGNEDGPVVIPGQSEKSKLLQVLSPDADPHMPPKKQLTDKQIAVLRGWIDEGAKWNEKALAAFGLETPLEKLGALPTEYQPVLGLALSVDGKKLAAVRGNSVRRACTTPSPRTSARTVLRHCRRRR